jgi:hypothetical protein
MTEFGQDVAVDEDAQSGIADMAEPFDLAEAMHYLVASTEPAVVFSSLAKLCVPAFSDTCTVEIVEADRADYRIGYPPVGSTPRSQPVGLANMAITDPADGHAISNQIEAPPIAGYSHYTGVITHTWREERADHTNAVIARLLLDCAVAAVHRERLAERAQHAEDKAANLEIALASNREIGMAMGILMSSRRVSEQVAFDLLRLASSHSHRKLRDLAAEVVQTGQLETATRRRANGAADRSATPHPSAK